MASLPGSVDHGAENLVVRMNAALLRETTNEMDFNDPFFQSSKYHYRYLN